MRCWLESVGATICVFLLHNVMVTQAIGGPYKCLNLDAFSRSSGCPDLASWRTFHGGHDDITDVETGVHVD